MQLYVGDVHAAVDADDAGESTSTESDRCWI